MKSPMAPSHSQTVDGAAASADTGDDRSGGAVSAATAGARRR